MSSAAAKNTRDLCRAREGKIDLSEKHGRFIKEQLYVRNSSFNLLL